MARKKCWGTFPATPRFLAHCDVPKNHDFSSVISGVNFHRVELIPQRKWSALNSENSIFKWPVEKVPRRVIWVGAKGKLDSKVGRTQMYYWHGKIEITFDPTDYFSIWGCCSVHIFMANSPGTTRVHDKIVFDAFFFHKISIFFDPWTPTFCFFFFFIFFNFLWIFNIAKSKTSKWNADHFRLIESSVRLQRTPKLMSQNP